MDVRYETKYWVNYGWENVDSMNAGDYWCKTSTFVTVGEGCEFRDLESWWVDESDSTLQHEIFNVVKL